ncbi:hypothetical protein CHS0354_018476 [Potamilus streckersoni]|uniref:Prokaryotic-type class I peptide chain release factors domain-containing protein n=1 Tax=Potamilus streckersoni TaxID=2493646 RepID=A0AAE0TAH1_9BIVA|nr:hypothetical protein CHS0354_018476 [Potamilus streckersoni]
MRAAGRKVRASQDRVPANDRLKTVPVFTNWEAPLLLDDAGLTAACEIQQIRGSGRGGQKRNKTSNAVRLSLMGFQVLSSNARSLDENRRDALLKLRLLLALSYGFDDTPDTATFVLPGARLTGNLTEKIHALGVNLNTHHARYPLLAGYLTDTFLYFRGDMRGMAAALGISLTALRRRTEELPLLKARFASVYQYFKRQGQIFSEPAEGEAV